MSILTRLWFKLVVLLAAILAIGVWTLLRAPKAAPVQEGTSVAFWKSACGVELGSTIPADFGGHFYLPREGWFIYGIQHIHGEALFRVKESAALADFPAVVQALEAEGQHEPESCVQQGFKTWQRGGEPRDDAQSLLAEIHRARLSRLQQDDPDLYEYVVAKESEFQRRWERAKRYWLTVLFELGFIAALVVFAALPWLGNAGRVGWSIHLGLLPTLLLLPWYLGYVPLVFTSAYPSGGIIYPQLIAFFRGLPWTELDAAIFEYTPKILEPLWQPTGPVLALTGMGAVGPVATACLGFAIGGVTFGIGSVLRRMRTRKGNT